MSALARAVAERRERAVSRLAVGATTALAIDLRTEGTMLVGAADGSVQDVAMALHGTYGWPVIPGSALKGVAQAYAARKGASLCEADLRIFGSPRPGGDDTAVQSTAAQGSAAQGTVRFLDALPTDALRIHRDVLTPHAGMYYSTVATAAEDIIPPADYLQPVPVGFLSASGRWQAFCIGPHDDVHRAVRLLTEAVDLLGIGAKTAAGYGYLSASEPVATLGPTPTGGHHDLD